MRAVPRRPTRLEQPPPGSRCPACWAPLALERLRVAICTRCFVYVAHTEGGRLVRLAPPDLRLVAVDARFRLAAEQASLISRASMAWRALPRVPLPAPRF